uniref:DUF7924 domain-containing protein n=1 Tax=Pyricularia oryzae (strain P131) TaxID=1143193 RepID=L7IRE3_PYRO1
MALTRAQIAAQKRPSPKNQGNYFARRQRESFIDSWQKSNVGEPAIDNGDPTHSNPVAFWAKKGQWPKDLSKAGTTLEIVPIMDRLFARKKSLSGASRKRSNSATSTTPSDQKPREEKSAPYGNARYSRLLQTKGSYMKKSELDITDASKAFVRTLLEREQNLPTGTYCNDDIFADICQILEDINEARVIQNISRLIVPSAELLGLRNKSYKHLIESVNAGWNNLMPLIGTRPQPDYSLFRTVKRESEINREILAFSISHDHRLVRIYGHYPVISGEDTTYYRHPIHEFSFTALDGKDKWTVYRFTKNVYDTWMPAYFQRICSAIDQLPSEVDFDVPLLSEATGFSQELESLMQLESGFTSEPVAEVLPSNDVKQQGPTQDTSCAGPGVTKKRKG